MPWLRFSSLVRSVMSVCSSAKPGDREVAVSGSQTHSLVGKAEAHSATWSPPATFTDFLSDLRFHLLHLQQRLLPVALGTAALGAEDEQGCGQRNGAQALEVLWIALVGTCYVQGLGLEGEVLPAGLRATSSGQGVGRWPSALPSSEG